MASTVVGFVLNKLCQFVTNEAILGLGLKEEIMQVKRSLEWLLAFLADADQKRREEQHETVRVWVSQLCEAAYDLEDVLDEYVVSLDLQQMGFFGWKASPFIHGITSPAKQLILRHDLASEIAKINKRLEIISSNKMKYHDNTFMSSSPRKETYKDLTINQIRNEVEADPTGQEAYIEKIRAQLLNSSAQRISVISICGMGGLGKTTLAKRLYDNDDVISHFNLRTWLTISQKFSGIDLLRRLLNKLLNLKREETMQMEEDEMKTKLKDHIRKKSFIIVLDDMWDISSLKYLQSIFPNKHEGIVVLLTTRNKNIATDVNLDTQVIELQPLDYDQSWQLFCKKAFVDANCPESLLQFKDEVIQRCKGLPLSIVILGGLLRSRDDFKYWRKFLDNISGNSRQEDYKLIGSILALSYDDLPQYLKACFLYIAIYPEDYDIQAGELMRMWIAEGFIEQQEEKIMEDIAEEYLEELMQRSLVQLVKRNKLG